MNILIYASEIEYSDDFINEIIDTMNDFYEKDLVLEKRIKDYNENKNNTTMVKQTQGERQKKQ